MLEGLVGDGQVAAAHDHHPLDLAMLQHGQVGQHVGIGAFVPAGDLDDVVQGHHPVVGHGVKDADVLVLALLIRQHLGDLHGLGVTLVETLHLDLVGGLVGLGLARLGLGTGHNASLRDVTAASRIGPLRGAVYRGAAARVRPIS